MASQLAAILVSDLVGSTALRAELGEEAAEELRREHDRLLAEAIQGASGTVVKGLGDGLLARFSGAAEAIDGAVAVQQSIARLGRRSGVDLAVRIGIALGDVTVEDGDVFGTPVIEAARLCAAAEGGTILVADVVRALSHGRGDHEFIPVGTLELKGLRAPLAAATVSWEELPLPGAVPVPAFLLPDLRFPFAGREAANQALAEAWKRSMVEERQLVLVAGEPGIGKTRLVSELATSVGAEGATVLLGRCFEDVHTPYAPFVEALDHLVAHARSDVLEDHVSSAGGELARLVPSLASRLPHLPAPLAGDPELERTRLYDAVIDLLAKAGGEAPVLLVLDDLHWADGSTIRMLLSVLRSSRPLRLCVVGTYRDTDIDRSHPLGQALAELRRTRGAHRVNLDGLDDDEVRSFLEQAGGTELDAEALAFARMLRAETEGNPFFLGEVLVHLIESRMLEQEEGRWVARQALTEAGVPEGVRDVVGRRLSALGPSHNDVLRAASVVGPEFDLQVLSSVCEISADELVDLLEEPCRRRLVLEAEAIDRYRFAHALIHQTLYEEIPAGRRARLHRAAADAIESQPAPSPADLARHLAAAGPLGDPRKAVRCAVDAAEEASRQRAWEQSIRFYDQALDMLDLLTEPDVATRARLHLARGQAMNAIGQEATAREDIALAADLARQADLTELFTAAALAYCGLLGPWVDMADERGPALLEEAARRLPAEPSAPLALVLARTAMWQMFSVDITDAMDLAQQATTMARALGDEELLLRVLRSLLMFSDWGADAARRTALVEEVVERAERAGDASALNDARLYRIGDRLRRGLVREAAQHAREVLDQASAIGARGPAFFAAANLNMVRIAAGRFDEAHRHLLRLDRRGTAVAEEATPIAQELWLALFRGDSEGRKRATRRFTDRAKGFGTIFPLLQEGIAGSRDASGVRDGLLAWHRDIRPRCPAIYAPSVDADAVFIMASEQVAVPEVAAHCHRSLLPFESQWVYPGPTMIYGSAQWLLGATARMLGRPDEAVERISTGLEQHQREGVTVLEAYAQLELAVALRDQGDGARAREAAGAAQHLAERIGMPAVARQAAALA